MSKYKGSKYACYYWNMWNTKWCVIRRVDTYKLLDSERIERSITFDIDNSKLLSNKVPETKNGVPVPLDVAIPLLILHKRPFLMSMHQLMQNHRFICLVDK